MLYKYECDKFLNLQVKINIDTDDNESLNLSPDGSNSTASISQAECTLYNSLTMLNMLKGLSQIIHRVRRVSEII